MGAVDGSRHFGLQMMKERFEAAGGSMFVDSRLGAGTLMVARQHPDGRLKNEKGPRRAP